MTRLKTLRRSDEVLLCNVAAWEAEVQQLLRDVNDSLWWITNRCKAAMKGGICTKEDMDWAIHTHNSYEKKLAGYNKFVRALHLPSLRCWLTPSQAYTRPEYSAERIKADLSKGASPLLHNLAMAMTPEPFPGQQDENYRCPLCDGAFCMDVPGRVLAEFRKAKHHAADCAFRKALEALQHSRGTP
jgi:hypothetical protein